MKLLLVAFFLAAATTRVSCTIYSHTEGSANAEEIPYATVKIVDLDDYVRFVGRTFIKVTIIPTRGCVAFGNIENPESVITNFTVAQQYELLCPLFDQYAKTVATGDKYTVKLETFKKGTVESAPLIEAVQNDILTASNLFLDYTPVVEHGFMITWNNARFETTTCESGTACITGLRNTFQITVSVVSAQGDASRSKTTFATFSYQETRSVSSSTRAGIIYGDNKGYQALPYSESQNSITDLLSLKSTLIGTTGRYIYEVTDIPQRIGCLNLPSESTLPQQPLTISENKGNMFGGTLVRMQAECGVANEEVNCAFTDVDENSGQVEVKGKAWYASEYTMFCIAPRVDMGRSELRVSREQNVGVGRLRVYARNFYFQTRNADNAEVEIESNNDYMAENFQGAITLWWDEKILGGTGVRQVEIELAAYKSESGTIKSEIFPLKTTGNSGSVTIETTSQCPADKDCEGYLIGHFVVKVKENEDTPTINMQTKAVAISSIPIPIGWYVRNHHRQKLGNVWYHQYCEPAYRTVIPPTCPCSRDLARADRRAFSPAPDCPWDVSPDGVSRCLLQKETGSYCYTRTLFGQEGVRCCYRDNGNLIYNSEDPLIGSYYLPYSPIVNYREFNVPGARTYLSYYLTHVKNYYTCCTAQGSDSSSAQCERFALQSQIAPFCTAHRPSVFAAVGGDPHFQMTNGDIYTFNGLGEYWFAYSTDPFHAKIQIRLGQGVIQFGVSAGSEPTFTKVNAAVVKAVAIKAGDTRFQVQVRPLSHVDPNVVNSKRLMILVDDVEQYWDTDGEARFYNDVRVATINNNQDYFQLNFINHGVLVECDYAETSPVGNAPSEAPGSMNCRFSYDSKIVTEVAGLIGTYVDTRVGLVRKEESQATNPTFAVLTDLPQVAQYAKTWHVTERDSLFTYVDTTYKTVNDENGYTPNLENAPVYITGATPEIEADTCTIDKYKTQCNYDYRITGSVKLAKHTQALFDTTDKLKTALEAEQNYCPALSLPYFRKSHTAGTKENSEVTLGGCVDGYEAQNTVTEFKCNKNGNMYTWSPANVDQPCVRSKLYSTATAKKIIPYTDATAEELGMQSFSAVYLGRELSGITAKIPMGCIELSSTAEAGYEPMICPLLADHSTGVADGVTEPYNFYAEIVTPNGNSADLLAEIAGDIKQVGDSLNAVYSDDTITTAYIFTWLEASKKGACTTQTACNSADRNSYQVVIAIGSSRRAYAVINYEKIAWSGRTNADTSKLEFSSAGFYYGDRKGSLQLPYSNTETSTIKKLVEIRTHLEVAGRFIYDISTFPHLTRLGCYKDKFTDLSDVQLLTVSSNMFDIFGGSVIRVQGYCYDDNLKCGFLKKTPNGDKWTISKIYNKGLYTGACITPRTPHIDVGWTRFVLTSDEGKTFMFASDIYFTSKVNKMTGGTLDIAENDNKFWLSTETDTSFTLNWFGKAAFSSAENVAVDLRVIGYNMDGEVYETFPAIAKAKMDDSSIKVGAPLPQCQGGNCIERLIGQLVLEVQAASVEQAIYNTFINRISISTPLIPIGWYIDKQQTGDGPNANPYWYENYCKATAGGVQVETLPQCPCTRIGAENERRIFFVAPDCENPISVPHTEHCFLTAAASICFTTLPNEKGHSIRCCYDEKDNLIQPQNSPLDGSYMLPDAINVDNQVNQPANSLLSYYLSHVKNVFACCSAHFYKRGEILQKCSEMAYVRAASKTCAGYLPSYWSATVGDPHFVTFDGAKYTFNGLGEFWYVYPNAPEVEAQIQVRIAQAKNTDNAEVNAGALSAIAYLFRKSKVEIHIQPLSFRKHSSRFLMILVDGKEQFWSENVNEQIINGFRIVANDEQFQVHVTVMGNGPSITCAYADTTAATSFEGMSCTVSVPNYYKRLIYGLGGFADDDVTNDLATRRVNTQTNIRYIDPANMDDVHKVFGNSWYIRSNESIFSYFDDSWETFNSDELKAKVPELKMPPAYNNIVTEAEVNATCKFGVNRNRCHYDYALTSIKTLAQRTLGNLDYHDNWKADMAKTSGQACDHLEIPYANVQLEGYGVNSTAVVTGCFKNYASITTFPVTYTCTQIGDWQPEWTPTPQAHCRSLNVLLSEQTTFTEVSPINPVMPSYTLPNTERREGTIMFGGKRITGFSIIAKKGCVALRENVIDASVEGNPEGIADVPLICPLFAEHASNDVPGDTYDIRFSQLDGRHPLTSELLQDIRSASVDLDPMVVNAQITHTYVFGWNKARSGIEPCTGESCVDALRNNYEVVLVITNVGKTYAVFNYKDIKWSGLSTGTEDQKKSFAAINYGDNRGTVYLPYAKNDVAKLTEYSTIIGARGRYIYDVTERIQRIGCLSLPNTYPSDIREPVTLNTFVGDVYGSRRLVAQSSCLPNPADTRICGFRKPFSDAALKDVPAYRLSAYSVACSSPRLPQVDLGEWEIVVATSKTAQSNFAEKIYLAESIEDSSPVKLNDTYKWFTAKPAGNLRIEWLPAWFEGKEVLLNVTVVAYAPSVNDRFRRKEFFIGRENNMVGSFEFDPTDFDCDEDCEGFLVGQVVVRVADNSIIYDPTIRYTEIASSLVPIGWLVDGFYYKKTGNDNWYYDFCNTTTVASTVKCPCHETLARKDTRSFIRTPNCKELYGVDCLVTPASTSCYSTLPQNADGNGLLCCYNTEQTLIYGQDEPLGGSFALQFTPTASTNLFNNTDATAYLSYYYGHPKNLFACCTAAPGNFSNSHCYEYTNARSVPKTCTDYEPSGVSGIVGDPHVLTPDNTIYTFNGVGEYWWLYPTNAVGKRPIRVQVRFQKEFKSSVIHAPPVSMNATLLTAISISIDNTLIQVEVEGVSYQFGTGRRLAIYVNNEQKFFDIYPTNRYYQGVRIESDSSHDYVKMNLPFNGPSINCKYVTLFSQQRVGAMSCEIFLTPAYKANVHGLIGRYDGKGDNDLVFKNGTASNTPLLADPKNFPSVHQFGLTWHITSDETNFDYHGTDYDELNKEAKIFEPILKAKPESDIPQSDITRACGSNQQFGQQCEYDYRITKSATFSTATANRLAEIRATQSELVVNNQFCPFLDIPYAAKTITQSVRLGSVANIVKCMNGRDIAASAPKRYTCRLIAGLAQWSPNPDKNTCVPDPNQTTRPAGITTAGPQEIISTHYDSTAVIILSIFLGLCVLAIIILVVYYYKSIAPKIKKVSSYAQAAELESRPQVKPSDYSTAL